MKLSILILAISRALLTIEVEERRLSFGGLEVEREFKVFIRKSCFWVAPHIETIAVVLEVGSF